MIEFMFNNIKHKNISHIFFKLNYSYYFQVFFQDKANFYLRFYLTNDLAKKLKNLILIY